MDVEGISRETERQIAEEENDDERAGRISGS